MCMGAVTAGAVMIKIKLNIRRRLLLLFLLLAFLPLLAYRFAIDLQYLLLTHQANLHQHTVHNLALILENRPELWGQTTAAGEVLSHIDFKSASIWIVNNQGQTTYVMGQLNPNEKTQAGWASRLGKSLIELMAFAKPLPYPYAQSATPEVTLIERALNGLSTQQYRTDANGEPFTLMSASPIYSQNQQIGALVYEQTLDTIFNHTLQHFHQLVGLGSLILFLVLLGVITYSTSLSNRILRLGEDVKQTFTKPGQLLAIEKFEPNTDELAELRQHIAEMLEKIASYERYLKQLPRALRHELHNPINRLSATLELVQMQQYNPRLEQAQQALNQLQHIIQALAEASSIEDSLANQSLQPLIVNTRLLDYFSGVQMSQPPGLVVIKNHVKVGTQIMAEGFMLEQCLDKLVDNALDFNNGECPIEVVLTETSTHLNIEISNCGVLLPEGLEKQIFDGMVSIRRVNQASQSHLGLGLHIARLIAEFHHAELIAFNRPDQRGVSVRLSIPLLTA